MRIQKSIHNILFALSNNIVGSILGFISRTIFIYTLGANYLGISGLLQNIFGLLAISELGISTAIGFSLYKPIANNDINLISTLMSVYKKAYRFIGIIVLVLGIVSFNYLDFFVDPQQQPNDIAYIYFMYLLNIVVGYFFSYKTTLIASDQNSYKLVPLQIKFTTITTILQIIYLLIFKDYLGYLTIQICSSIFLNFIQNRFITKQYSYIDFNSKKKLPKDELKIIKRNIFGLMVAKLGDFCVNSTDNLIISKYIDLTSVAIYSNYILLRNLVNGYIGILFGSITASFGNLVAKESNEKCLEVFNNLFFISFLLYSFEAVCFICLFNPFIKLWLGEQYLFSMPIVTLIVLNNYLTGLRIPIITIKNAAGVYVEDVWVSFGFAIINLFVSIMLATRFGVFGVILGSIISSLLTADWYRPVIIFKKIFKISPMYYFKSYFKYIFLGLIYMAGTYSICQFISSSDVLVNFIVRGLICLIVPNAFNLLLFYKSKEFDFFQNILINLINKFKKNEERNMA